METRIRKVATLIVGLGLTVSQAQACSVCFIGDEHSRFAYYFTTGLLSLLPLAMIGGMVFYIAKKYR